MRRQHPAVKEEPVLDGLYRPRHNCWRIEQARHVSIIVDYGNYYRDLHESIVKAQRSIFVLGWDIDSRIELLRGKDAKASPYPSSFYDLICWKAHQSPDLQIYLNKWDYSAFFMREREPFWEHHWAKCGLPNIHYRLDDVLPLGACHHQKIVVIDDEIAYWGGMDVALGRWDFREHHVINRNRVDPAPLPHPTHKEHFSPYHDIQAVLSGPAATALAELVRERWRAVSPQDEPVKLVPNESEDVPATWPDSDPPDFYDVNVVIARTMPAMGKTKQIEEVYRQLLDEIATAENFIYIENQFLVQKDIARALNKRLRERPALRVLAISCYNPQGIMESRSMWTNRIHFRSILEQGEVAERVALAYPASPRT